MSPLSPHVLLSLWFARAAAREAGPVNAMDTNALHSRKRSAQGAKAGRVPGEPLQRSDGRFRQQPDGNGRLGAPLFVALLAKTASLGFVGCRDWRPMPPVRVCAHSVNRPWLRNSQRIVPAHRAMLVSSNAYSAESADD